MESYLVHRKGQITELEHELEARDKLLLRPVERHVYSVEARVRPRVDRLAQLQRGQSKFAQDTVAAWVSRSSVEALDLRRIDH